MGNKNKATRQNANRKLVGAIKEHLSGSVTLDGVKYAPATLAKMFQDGIDIADATDKAAKSWHLAVATEKENTQKLSGVQTSLRNYVSATFGETGTEFAAFGFTPRAVTTVDVATKAQALAKRAATRAARGTRGKRQKEEIKGSVVAPAAPAVPAITTPAAPPAAGVSAANATNGSTNGTPTSAPSANGVVASH
jgi:hypothetical protein